MSERQRLTWIIGIGFITLMALFPPWVAHSVWTETRHIPGRRDPLEVEHVEPTVSYALFIAPPTVETRMPAGGSSKAETVTLIGTILWERLVLQLSIVAGTCAVVSLFLGRERPAGDEENDLVGEAEGQRPVNLEAARAFATPENLQQARKRAGLSQTDLAEVLGVRMRDVNLWERGRKKVPGRLAVVLYKLLGGGDEE